MKLSTIDSFLSFADRPLLLAVSFFLAIPLYIMVGKLFFDDWDDFLEALRFFYQPWWLSAFRGELEEDQWSGVKLLFYIISCVAMLTTVYKLLKLML